MDIPKNIKSMMQQLLNNSAEAYLIGGSIRDHFLGIIPHDYDIFTNVTGEEILKIFPNGKVLGNEERQKKILTVIVNGIEISQYRSNSDRTETGNNLLDHLATCDFTINAIACDIKGKIIDPYNGYNDILRKTVQFVGDGEDRIKEDPLRILRGVRFWGKMGIFQDLEIVLKNLNLLDTIPVERIREEFMKIIKYPRGIKNLWNSCIIYRIIPELKKVLIMEGGDHHDETVDNHMMNAFKEACKITDNTLLRLAIFLHDIGKGETQSFDKNNKQTHFYKHDKVGAEIVILIMKRLKFSRADTNYVTTLVRLHMFGYNERITDKTYIKFFDKLNKNKIHILDYIMLIYCDHQGNMSKPRIKFGDFLKSSYLYQNYLRLKTEKKPFNENDLEIDGKDIINAGTTPGPMIKRIKLHLFDLVLEGKLLNRRDRLLEKLQELTQK